MARLAGAVAVCAAAAVLSLTAAAAGGTTRTVVKVTVHGHPGGSVELNGTIGFSPATVKRGTVVFRIKNADSDEHQFSINGRDSKWIGAHRTGVLTVTFTRAGRYSGTCPDADGAISGLLTVT